MKILKLKNTIFEIKNETDVFGKRCDNEIQNL